MRQRITFIQEPQDAVNPELLRVQESSFNTQGLKAAREDRLTFGFSELPQELYRVLKQCHELHIRWASTIPYDVLPPFASRLSPGLHVSYTPQRKLPHSYVPS